MKNNIQGCQNYENAFKLASLNQQPTTFRMWNPHSLTLIFFSLGMVIYNQAKKKTTQVQLETSRFISLKY